MKTNKKLSLLDQCMTIRLFLLYNHIVKESILGYNYRNYSKLEQNNKYSYTASLVQYTLLAKSYIYGWATFKNFK